MEYFKQEDFETLKKYAGKKYNASIPAYKIFVDNQKKLEYFVSYISEQTGLEFTINRREKINKQAGRAATYNNFADYLLVGFCPSEFHIPKTLFIKVAIHGLTNEASLMFELDRDFTSEKYRAHKEVAEKVVKLQPIHGLNLKLKDIYNLDWKGLYDKVSDAILNLIDDYNEVYNEFYTQPSEHFGILANMGWNTNGWKTKPTAEDIKISKAFGYVSKNLKMHECLNFGHELLPAEENDHYLGYTSSFNRLPSYKEGIRIVFLSATNPNKIRVIVGCYAFPEIGKFERNAKHDYYKEYYDANIKSKVSNIVYFENFIPIDIDKFIPAGKKLSNQSFNYLTKANVANIFTRAIELNPVNEKLKNIESMVVLNQNDNSSHNENTDQNGNPEKSPNIILYGPPGTGKTYHTVELAYKIIMRKVAESHQIAQDFFKEERGKRLDFVTFHQNIAYEDFVIGLKPDVKDDTKLIFKRKYGTFFEICKRAKDNYLESKKVESKNDKYISFDEVFGNLVGNVPEEKVVFGEKAKFNIYDYSETTIYYEAEDGTRDNWRSLSIDTLRQFYETDDLTKLIEGGRKHYYKLLYKKLQEIKSKLQVKIGSVDRENYVLIIDEINRANISRVFGELITLLEKDKRLDAEHEITVSLPNGEPFNVPPNLYIIGTMNTADKSIALIDIALRRRFEFRRRYPVYNIDGHEVYYNENLRKMNEKIKELKGPDFQIGHSYFMGDDFELTYTMNNQVIPLLYEYFMNDDEAIKEVLKAGRFSYDDKTESGLIEFIAISLGKEIVNAALKDEDNVNEN